MKTLTQKKDGNLVIRLFDKNTGEPANITGWTLIKMRLIFSWGAILEKFAPLTNPVDEIQKITADDTPDAGTFTIGIDGIGDIDTQTTAAIAFDASAVEVQTAINALIGVNDVQVSGAWPEFILTFTNGSGGRDWPIMILTSLLTKASVAVVLTPTEETKGVAKNGIDVIFNHPAKIKVYLSEDDLSDLKDGTLDIDPHIRIGEDDLSIPIHRKAAITESIP